MALVLFPVEQDQAAPRYGGCEQAEQFRLNEFIGTMELGN